MNRYEKETLTVPELQQQVNIQNAMAEICRKRKDYKLQQFYHNASAGFRQRLLVAKTKEK